MARNRQAAPILRERAILATIAGVTGNVDWLTSDRIEALTDIRTGRHGMHIEEQTPLWIVHLLSPPFPRNWWMASNRA